MSKGHCAVFLDNATLMVIGGQEGFSQYANTTYMLNINARDGFISRVCLIF